MVRIAAILLFQMRDQKESTTETMCGDGETVESAAQLRSFAESAYVTFSSGI